LKSSRSKLTAVADELLRRDALTYEDLVAILGQPVNAKFVKVPPTLQAQSAANAASVPT